MHLKEEAGKFLERLLNFTLDHFHIDIPKSTIVITYNNKTIAVFSESVEKLYRDAFEAYQMESSRYQEALHTYEEIEQAFLQEQEGVTHEDVQNAQRTITEATPSEYSQWYKEFIQLVIKDDWQTFEKAVNQLRN